MFVRDLQLETMSCSIGECAKLSRDASEVQEVRLRDTNAVCCASESRDVTAHEMAVSAVIAGSWTRESNAVCGSDMQQERLRSVIGLPDRPDNEDSDVQKDKFRCVIVKSFWRPAMQLKL